MSKFIRRVGYLRFGRFLEPWIEKGRFEQLNIILKKAGMDISVRSYLGSAIFSSILVGLLSMVLSIVGGLALLGPENFAIAVVIGLIVGPLVGSLTYLPFLYWPRMRAQDRKILLDAGLTSTASYLSAMSSSGVPPDRLFYSLAGEESVAPEISKESKRITRDIEIFGYDIINALRAASERSPSDRFSKFLDGISSTITSGGDLTYYLAAETKAHMKLKEAETKEFIEQLGVLAEIFMILGVVAPLFFVIILAILGVISPDATELMTVIMLLLTYFLMPIMLTIMILLVSSVSREI